MPNVKKNSLYLLLRNTAEHFLPDLQNIFKITGNSGVKEHLTSVPTSSNRIYLSKCYLHPKLFKSFGISFFLFKDNFNIFKKKQKS